MRPSFRLFICAALVAICASELAAGGRGQSAAHADWARERWTAQWTACPEAPQRDACVFHFRKTIDLAVHSKRLLVYVSADNRFILFVNATRIREGPARSSLGHWNCEA